MRTVPADIVAAAQQVASYMREQNQPAMQIHGLTLQPTPLDTLEREITALQAQIAKLEKDNAWVNRLFQHYKGRYEKIARAIVQPEFLRGKVQRVEIKS